MKSTIKLMLVGGLLSLSSLSFASEGESKHFKGEKVENLAQAVKVFSEQNKKFAAMIADNNVDLQEMGQIHQMTYSMENALRKIKAEVEAMEHLLEEVHEGSEKAGNQAIIKDGRKYLEKAQTLVP